MSMLSTRPVVPSACLLLWLLATGCGDDSSSADGTMMVGDGDSTMVGDGDSTTAGDGDTSMTGDGDATMVGDGDTTTGGDGDATMGGDGDATMMGDGDAMMDDDAGVGDGDNGDGDSGDGDAAPECAQDADCDDTDATTFDECDQDGACVNRAVYYDTDMQAIFGAKCTNCHTTVGGACARGRCFAQSYATVNDDASSSGCAGDKVYECIDQRVGNGSMPQGRGCTGNPETDADDPDCLTAREHALLDAWVAAGAPEAP